MKISIFAPLAALLFGFGMHSPAFAQAEGGSCSSLEQQYDALEDQVERACDGGDRASRGQCSTLEKQLSKLEDALDECEDGGDGDGDSGDDDGRGDNDSGDDQDSGDDGDGN